MMNEPIRDAAHNPSLKASSVETLDRLAAIVTRPVDQRKQNRDEKRERHGPRVHHVVLDLADGVVL